MRDGGAKDSSRTVRKKQGEEMQGLRVDLRVDSWKLLCDLGSENGLWRILTNYKRSKKKQKWF